MISKHDPHEISTNDGSTWRAAWGGNGKVVVGKTRIKRLLRRWSPYSNLYLSPPFCSTFVPAIQVSLLRGALLRNYTRRLVTSALMLLAAIISLALSACLKDDITSLRLGACATLVLGFIAIDYRIVIRSHASAIAYSTFYLWIREHRVKQAAIWIGGMTIIGVSQALLQMTLDWDLEALIKNLGAYYPYMKNGELWRAFSGPFVHASAAHWACNTISLGLAVALTFPVNQKTTFAVFVLSSTLGVLAAWGCAAASDQDAYAGISAGVFGLFGYVIALSARLPSLYPPRFCMWIGTWVAVDVLGSAVLSSSTSNIGHLMGVVTGILAGYFLKAYSPCAHAAVPFKQTCESGAPNHHNARAPASKIVV